MKIIEGIIVGISVMAIAASAKAIVDVKILQANRVTVKETLREIKEDIKYIRSRIDGINSD